MIGSNHYEPSLQLQTLSAASIRILASQHIDLYALAPKIRTSANGIKFSLIQGGAQ